MIYIYIVVLWVYVMADLIMYWSAKYPERSQHWWSYLPLSGFIAFYKYGKN